MEEEIIWLADPGFWGWVWIGMGLSTGHHLVRLLFRLVRLR